MSPDFLTPISYFKPHPGSALVDEAVARGYSLPQPLEAWSKFEYLPSEPGPWASRAKHQVTERFKSLHELACKRVPRSKRLLQRLARYRCRTHGYSSPVEMLLKPWLVPVEKLS